MFVANKGAVHITDLLFEVNLVPSELLCPLWMEKFVQIGWIVSYGLSLSYIPKEMKYLHPFSNLVM